MRKFIFWCAGTEEVGLWSQDQGVVWQNGVLGIWRGWFTEKVISIEALSAIAAAKLYAYLWLFPDFKQSVEVFSR